MARPSRGRRTIPGHRRTVPCRRSRAGLRIPWMLAIALPAAHGGALAQAPPATLQGGDYRVDQYTVDGGGGTSSGGAFEIRGTIGQPDADPLQPSTGGVFEITGGFWPGLAPATPQPDALFANGFE